MSPQIRSPLSGIRVLDFSRVLAGPYCTMLLGDLGAEILKIERPGTGDDTRQWKPPSLNGSVALNLKSKEGVKIAKELAAKSDVVIENFLPGTMDKMNLGYSELEKINPGLIYCSISGYGSTGPYAKRGGYDVIAAAIGGFMHITGEENGGPCKAGVAITDVSTGLYAYGSILAALLQRHQTQKGQKIECNLLSTQVATLVNIGSNYLNSGIEGKRWGTAHESIVPYEAFKTSDSYLIVGAGNNRQFQELCSTLNQPDLASNPEFVNNADRVQNRVKLIAILQKMFSQKTTADWLSLFNNSTFPYGPINDLQSVFRDPQVVHNNIVDVLTHPRVGEIRVAGHPVKFGGSEVKSRLPPPTLGEHTDAVLKGLLNYSDDQIERLYASQVLGRL